MKKYNFNAGPSILPREVIENTAKQILDFNGSGLSIMEISHRAKDFQPVLDEAVALIKELLSVPEGYSVIFLGGGASLQFTQVPCNFLIKKAAYLNTGVWAKKSMKEAKLYGDVVEVATSADANFTYIPKTFDMVVLGKMWLSIHRWLPVIMSIKILPVAISVSVPYRASWVFREWILKKVT